MIEIPKTYYRVSIKGLILDESRTKFLIQREVNDYWDLPGGGLDAGEDIFDCLRREILEEAGLTITNIAKFPSYLMVGKNMKGRPSANVVYEASVKDLNIKTSDECQEIRFVTPKEALALNTWRNVRELAAQFDPSRHKSLLD